MKAWPLSIGPLQRVVATDLNLCQPMVSKGIHMAVAPKADTKPSEENSQSSVSEAAGKTGNATPRKIPGNLPYLTASGTLKKALERIIEASRPEKFNYDFLENVLKLKGGSARAVPPLLKRMGFLTSEGSPTEVYNRFRSESGRGPAALQGLRNGFSEIFKRSEYAHAVDEAKLRDIVVEITGLKPTDPVAVAIRGTFNAVKGFIPAGMDPTSSEDESLLEEATPQPTPHPTPQAQQKISARGSGQLGLSYNINIVLPETSDLRVLNAIFRSLKENLL